MGIFQRISSATRSSLNDIKSRTFGRSNRPLAELTDVELEEEVLRRRRDRAAGRQDPRHSESPVDRQLVQYYANLELDPTATIDDIKSAYRRLMRKYHPDKHLGEPGRHRAATELAAQLTRAYDALLEHLQR
jgi:DnaJ-domain-containing protein 1